MNTKDKLERGGLGDVGCLAELIREAFRKSDDKLVIKIQNKALEASSTLQEKMDQLEKILEITEYMDSNVWHEGHLTEEEREEDEAVDDREEEPIGAELAEMLQELDF